jgi:hypothetical protein
LVSIDRAARDFLRVHINIFYYIFMLIVAGHGAMPANLVRELRHQRKYLFIRLRREQYRDIFIFIFETLAVLIG